MGLTPPLVGTGRKHGRDFTDVSCDRAPGLAKSWGPKGVVKVHNTATGGVPQVPGLLLSLAIWCFLKKDLPETRDVSPFA